MPPWKPSRKMLRYRVLRPWPHVAEHAPNVPQAETWQSTGHSAVPHMPSSASRGHGVPPKVGCCFTARLRDQVPVPHVRLHALQLPQSCMTQGSVHAAVLQGCDCNTGW